MEREQFVIGSTELGTTALSIEAIVQIVGQAAAESVAALEVHIDGVRSR